MIPLKLIRGFMSIYTPLKYKQEQFQRWLLSFIPIYLQQVIFISEGSSFIKEIYNYTNGFQWNKMNNSEFKDGYYLFTYWCAEKYSIERIILHTSHIKKALHINDLDNLWAFHEASLVILLKKYIKNNQLEKILDIFLNDENIYKLLIKYIPCMEISKNITPRIVYILSQCEKNEGVDNKQEDFHVKYYTDILDEIEKKLDEYLVA